MENFLHQIDWRCLISLAVSVILGGLIGLEREIHKKPAGLRTNILICLGAAAFMLIAGKMLAGTDAVSRMMAGIATGVGFIGGGALLRGQTAIHGVTTAATIWVVTSIGIACGMYFYEIAVFVTILSLIILIAFHPLDRRIHKSIYKPTSKTENDRQD
jgi:putative Mg2+ transporter-C (MgtC) family protein